MKSLVENRFHRESFISSSSSVATSDESFDSTLSNVLNIGYRIDRGKEIVVENESSKGNGGFYCTQLLFFGPLILFLILLISSIAVFFLIQRREQIKTDEEVKFDGQFPDGLKKFLSKNFHCQYFRRFPSAFLRNT